MAYWALPLFLGPPGVLAQKAQQVEVLPDATTDLPQTALSNASLTLSNAF